MFDANYPAGPVLMNIPAEVFGLMIERMSPKEAKAYATTIPDFWENKGIVEHLIRKTQSRICIATGFKNSLALVEDGAVFSWGWDHGQLMLGHTADQHTPRQIAFPFGTEIIKIVSGCEHSLALAADGGVFSWGNNDKGQLGIGHAYAFGTSIPRQIAFPAGTKIIKIAAGAWHSLALTADGRAFSWGRNDDDQLGLGHNEDQKTPRQIAFPADTEIIEIAAGDGYSLALAADGSVFVCGLNERDQLGFGDIVDKDTFKFVFNIAPCLGALIHRQRQLASSDDSQEIL